MKRLAIRISLVILLGVVTSVAVAWSVAFWTPLGLTAHKPALTAWMGPVPPDWPSPNQCYQHQRFGFTLWMQQNRERGGNDGVLFQEMCAGWPFRSLECKFWNETRGGVHHPLSEGEFYTTYKLTGRQRVLPLTPIYTGLLANTAIYGGVWWAMLFGPGVFIRWRRKRAGGCAKCGYDLRGMDSNACPECGALR